MDLSYVKIKLMVKKLQPQDILIQAIKATL